MTRIFSTEKSNGVAKTNVIFGDSEMKLYETKGGRLALNLDGNEVERLLTTAHEWQRENPYYRFRYGGGRETTLRARDEIERLSIDLALIPIADRLADDKLDEVKSARLWAVFSAFADEYPPTFGTTLAPVDFDKMEQFVEFGNATNLVVYSRPFAECLNVYRVETTDWKNPIEAPATRYALNTLPLIVSNRVADLPTLLIKMIHDLCPRDFAPNSKRR